jgi:hypothetical protein
LTIYNICVNIFEIMFREVKNMSQLAIYIDNQLAERLDKAAKASGKSKSKWVSDAIKMALQDQWPEGFFDLAGSWEDDVGPDEIMSRIRKGMRKSDKRENLR